MKVRKRKRIQLNLLFVPYIVGIEHEMAIHCQTRFDTGLRDTGEVPYKHMSQKCFKAPKMQDCPRIHKLNETLIFKLTP